MVSHPEGMQTLTARLASFDSPKIKGRKRTSTKGKKTNTNWPLESPTPEELAQAGFYLTATASSPDNVTCFHCLKSLDEWEEGDNAFREHLQFAPECAWAVTVAVERGVILKDEEHDPLADEFVDVRVATFGTSWPHENKKGWTPKIKKLVDAGWHYHPMPDEDDQTKCAYCSLCVSGWEPKDKPIEEHKRRSPECSFFRLIEAHKKTRKARKARASKVSRASTLSTATFSKETNQSMLDDTEANIDDSIMTTATDVTTASTATNATSATRKSARAKKPTAKATRGKKKAEVEDEEEEEPEKMEVEADEPVEVEPEPTRPSRKRSSAVMLEDEDADVAPASKKRAGRGRSSTARPASTARPETTPELKQETETLHEEPSVPEAEEAAVQDASMTTDEAEVLSMPKRGRKASAAGKAAGSRTASKTTRKASGGRKASQRNASAASVSVATVIDATAMTDAEIEAKLEADLERPLSDEDEDPLSGEARHDKKEETEQQEETKPKRGRPKKTASRNVSKTVSQPRPVSNEAEDQTGVDVDAVIDELAMMEQDEAPVPAARLFANHYEDAGEADDKIGRESEGSVVTKPKGKKTAKKASITVAVPAPAPAPKPKRGRPAKKASSEAAEPKSEETAPTELRFSSSFEEVPSTIDDSAMPEEQVEAKVQAKPAAKLTKAGKPVKAPAATKKGKGKKASAVLTKSEEHFDVEQEEQRQQKHAQVKASTPPAPEPEEEERAMTPEEEPTPAASAPGAFPSPTPSLGSTGSNAENEPPSSRPPSTRPPLATLTPNHTVTRVPLGSAAPSTPSRSVARTRDGDGDGNSDDTASPGWALQSSFPWRAVDIENVFLQSPEPKARMAGAAATATTTKSTKWFTAGDQENQSSQPLQASKDIVVKSGAAGKKSTATAVAAATSAAAKEKEERIRQMQATLSAAEKEMTVEQWIRRNAARGEEMLRRECERVVGRFEGEGIRAMKALEGLVVEEWA